MTKKVMTHETGYPAKKTDIVRDAVAAGQWKKALSIAKDFRLGLTKEQHDDVTRAYECMVHPRFYTSLGMDTASIVTKGVDTICKLYGRV